MQVSSAAATIGIIAAGSMSWMIDFYELYNETIRSLSATATLVLSCLAIVHKLMHWRVSEEVRREREQNRLEREEIAKARENLKAEIEAVRREQQLATNLLRGAIRSPVTPQKGD